MMLCVIVTTPSVHNFKSQNFKLCVSNPKNKYAAYVSVLSQISNCQGLGCKHKHEMLKTDSKHLPVDSGTRPRAGCASASTNHIILNIAYLSLSIYIYIYTYIIHIHIYIYIYIYMLLCVIVTTTTTTPELRAAPEEPAAGVGPVPWK